MPMQQRRKKNYYNIGGKKFYKYRSKEPVAKRALKMAYNLKQLINVEFKETNTQIDTTVGDSMHAELLNGLSKGTNNNQRMGDSIRIKSIEVNSYAYKNSNFTGIYQRVRRVILLDLQSNAAAPTQNQIFDQAANEPTLEFRNLDFKKRFVILKDDVVQITQNDPVAAFPKYYYQMNMHTSYDASDNGDVTDISSNAVYVIFISTEGTAADEPSVVSNHRVRYIDN